jgi:hypothetical protein
MLIATSVLILGGPGAGRAQISCTGDCNSNGTVAIEEIVSGVAIALQRRPISACFAMDGDFSQDVSISELTSAIGSALNGCPLPSCGDQSVMARFRACVSSRKRADCESAGGEWGSYPFSGMMGCFCPTGQQDCPCTKADDCLSICSAGIAGGFDYCATVEMGTCDAVTPIAGCFCAADQSPGSFFGFCNDP